MRQANLERLSKPPCCAPSASSSQPPKPTAGSWVPDEVNECPSCNAKFSLTLRRHHCRACGRVFCGRCTDNRIGLSGPEKESRVCDSCYEKRMNSTTAALTEDRANTNRLIEQSLKAALKEKHEQAEWFRRFMKEVGDARGQTRSGVDIHGLEANDAADGTVALSPRLVALVRDARDSWAEAFRTLREDAEENERLAEVCDALEQHCDSQSAAAKRTQDAIRGMESELVRRAQVEAERDRLDLKTRSTQTELAGLNERIEALEILRAPPSESVLRTISGSFASSFTGMTSASSDAGGGGRPSADRCTRRCVLM